MAPKSRMIRTVGVALAGLLGLAVVPWAIKWSRGFCNTLLAEGYWGGHIGPWFHRERFGLAFWDLDPSNNNSNAGLRAKWSGELMPNLYCNPAEPGCDPANSGP